MYFTSEIEVILSIPVFWKNEKQQEHTNMLTQWKPQSWGKNTTEHKSRWTINPLWEVWDKTLTNKGKPWLPLQLASLVYMLFWVFFSPTSSSRAASCPSIFNTSLLVARELDNLSIKDSLHMCKSVKKSNKAFFYLFI